MPPKNGIGLVETVGERGRYAVLPIGWHKGVDFRGAETGSFGPGRYADSSFFLWDSAIERRCRNRHYGTRVLRELLIIMGEDDRRM